MLLALMSAFLLVRLAIQITMIVKFKYPTIVIVIGRFNKLDTLIPKSWRHKEMWWKLLKKKKKRNGMVKKLICNP